MSNVFDQFDVAATPMPVAVPTPPEPLVPSTSNPFDQFDLRGSQPQVASVPPPQTLTGDEPAVTPSTSQPAPSNLLQEFTQGFRRGSTELDLGARSVLPFALGAKDEVTFAREAAAARRYVQSLPKSEALSEAEQKNLGARLLDPTYLASTLGAMAPGTGAAIAGSAVGALGGPAGAITGLGASSALIAYGSRFMQYLEEKGVRTEDEKMLLLALQDKDLVNEAHWFAARSAGAEGIINALGGAVAGKFAPRFFAPVGPTGERIAATATQKLQGAGGLVGVGGATEAGAEAGAQVAGSGSITNPEAVLEEGAFGLIVGAPTLAVPAASAAVRAGRKTPLPKADSGTPTPPASTVTLDENGIPVLDPKLIRERVDVSDPLVQETSTVVASIIESQKGKPTLGGATPDAWIKWTAQFGDNRVAQKLAVFFEGAKARGKKNITTTAVLQELAPYLVSAREATDIRTSTMQKDIVLKQPGAPEKEVSVGAGLDEGQRRSFFIEPAMALSSLEAQRLVETARERGYSQVVWSEESAPRIETAMKEAFGKIEEHTLSQEFAGRKAVRGIRIPEVKGAEPSTVARSASASIDPAIHDTLGQRQKYSNDELTTFTTRVGEVILDIGKRFGISDVKFRAQPLSETPTTHKNYRGWADYTAREIVVIPDNADTLVDVYSTAAHELGHFVAMDKLAKADVSTQIAILSEYGRFLHKIRAASDADVPIRYQRLLRDTVSNVVGSAALYDRATSGPQAFQFDAAYSAYWHSFSEWFAQQVARWATTDQKPLSVTEKFFAGLAKAITRIVGRLYKYAGLQLDAAPAVEAWLNAFMQDVQPQAFASIYDKILSQTMLENQAAMAAVGGQYVDPVARTASTDQPRLVIGRLFGGRPPKELKSLPAFADKINRFYNLMLGVVQLAKQNAHVRDLVLYNEKVRLADLERVNVVSSILPTVKRIKRLGKKQVASLSTLLDDYGQMRYRTDEEIVKGVERLPTDAELQALSKRSGADERVFALFDQMRKDYDGFLLRIEELLKYEAGKLPGLEAQAARLFEIEEQMQRFRRTPYVPQMRFGRFTVTVRSKKGETLAFATAESKREQALIAKDLKEAYPLHGVNLSILQDSVLPLRGMPPGLLRLIAERLDLDPEQQRLAHDLQFELAPAQSFKHRLQRRRNVTGYSKDFLRSYASYFMHGANYLVRAKYADELQGHVKATHEQSRFMPDGNKRAQIANYLAEHLRDWLDPKPDWWRVKAAGFLWALGYNVKSAVVNLTSLPLLSYPHLARGFGDLSSSAALLKAGADLSTYWKKASLDKMDAPRLRMLAELYNEGTITEALAPQLAGVAEGRNLIEKFAGSPTQRAFQWLLESAATVFQLTEQMNRRITAVAAFDLAMRQPDSKYIREALTANPLQYQRLIERGFNPIEAAAITTAKDAIETTQGIYTKSARPTFMRGRKGAIFQFKSFQQNTLWTMWNYPATGTRSMLVFAALGGFLGVPLAQDLIDMLKVLGWQLFGKDFDLEREARLWLADFADMSPEAVDGLMHGTSRYGFGLPVLMDLMGNHSFSVDASGVSLGQLSPVELSSLLGPVPDKDRAVARATERGVGAGLGLGFAAYSVLTDPTNEQAWMRLVPRAITAAWRAYNAAEDKAFTRPDGSTIMAIDPTNAIDAAYLVAQGLGYRPTQVAQQQERERAIYEVTAFWDMRRETIMRQFAEALHSNDQDDRGRMLDVIRKFNVDMPEAFRAKRISSEDLRRSVQSRETRRAKRSAGVPTNRRDVGIANEIGRAYPQAEVISERAVR